MSASLVIMMLVCVPSAVLSEEQNLNVREQHSGGVSLDIGGIVFGGLSLDTFLSNRMNLEICLGYGVGGGVRFHPRGSDPEVLWSPYLGTYFGMFPDIDINIFGSGDDSDWRPNVYIPLGVHYISRSGFSLALEVGWMHAFQDEDQNTFDIPMGACKIGLRI